MKVADMGACHQTQVINSPLLEASVHNPDLGLPALGDLRDTSRASSSSFAPHVVTEMRAEEEPGTDKQKSPTTRKSAATTKHFCAGFDHTCDVVYHVEKEIARHM